MRLEFINNKSPFYKDAVAIRTALFFDNMGNSSDLINDAFESDAIHVVCLQDKEVVGTGRLHFENEVSVISQMAIKTSCQKQGIGTAILIELIKYCKEKELFAVKLSARETALDFYRKFGFVAIGDKYPSKKTGVIHQKMVLKIE